MYKKTNLLGMWVVEGGVGKVRAVRIKYFPPKGMNVKVCMYARKWFMGWLCE